MIDRRVACLGFTTALLAGAAEPVWADMSTDRYAEAIKRRIDEVAAAQKLRDHKLGGMTLIAFQIDAAGRLTWRNITQGSNDQLNQLALRVLDAAAPFPPLPAGLGDHVWVWLLSLDAKLNMVTGSGPNG